MLTIATTCTACQGTRQDPNASHGVPMLPDGSSWDPAALPADLTIDTSRDHSIVKCWRCTGLKGPDGRTYARAGYHGAYKNTAALKAAVTRGTAVLCGQCAGTGQVCLLPYVKACYSCSGVGAFPVWDPDVDPILPPQTGICDHAPTEFIAAWLESCRIEVVRLDRGQTFNEAYLGLGTLWSTTDYGDAARTPDAELIAKVREQMLTSRIQFITITDRETRRVATHLVITVTRNGYAPRVIDKGQTRPLLPPTYTDDALNRLVN